jgi:uncharacterized membrane protein (UPF0182 family)
MSPDLQPKRRGGVLLPTLLILVGIVVAFVIFTGFYTELLWFDSVGKSQVFSISLFTRAIMFAILFLIMAIVTSLALFIAFRTRPSYVSASPEQASLERYRVGIEPYRKWIATAIVFGLSFFAGLAGSSEYGSFLLWRNSTPFGQVDPQFGLDFSFYTFELPFYRFALGFAFTLVILSLLIVTAVQYLYGGLRLQPKGDRASRAAQVQLSILLAVLILLKALAYYLDRFGLVTKSETLVSGFTGLKYADVNAVLPALNILVFVAILVAALFIFNIFRRQWVIPSFGLGLLILTSVVIGGLYPMIVQQFQVRPSELVREAPYIQLNIDATRDAYSIVNADVVDYAGSVSPPTVQTLEASAGTLSNIRLLDPAIVSPTYNQLQQIRGYYSFNTNLDVDRYDLPQGRRGAVVAVREINLAGIPDGQRNWTNDRAVYTHGYGFVSAFDNTALSDGTPDFFASDIPPIGELEVTQPRVYFGELSPQYSIVGAPKGSPSVELDYPDDASPTGQATNTYDGAGGVPMGSFFGKMLFATKFQDSNILLSDLVNEESQIMWDRTPLTRVEKVAPWLTLDQDPYPVVADGRIQWIVDGYTLSNEYPYSSRVSLADATSDSISNRVIQSGLLPRDQVNYMRNSVKAVVDAYEGSVKLYAWDETDPVLQTWMKAFPDVVDPRSAMSDDILAHVRYPQDIFKVQRNIMSRYHVTDAVTFYNGTDVWIVPFDPTVAPAQVFQPPYYLTLQMPGQVNTAFSLTTTFAPQRRQTLAAFMAVNSSPGENYGDIQVLQLPSNTTIPGPQQVQNNFESDPDVSSQLSLLRRGGSEVELGNLLSLPFNGGLLYVEPVYIRAAADGYPLLRKVLAGYGANVALEDNLAKALAKVLGTSPDAIPETIPNIDLGGETTTGDTTDPGGTTTTPTDPIEQLAAAVEDAQAAFAEGRIALAEGDFAAYGQAQDRLQAAITRIAIAEALLNPRPVSSPPEPVPAVKPEAPATDGANA